MATKKPAPKKAAAKHPAKPVKKGSPVKKAVAKPAHKSQVPAKKAAVKPVKKAVPKKAAPVKKVAVKSKPAPKPSPKPVSKPVSKHVVKPLAKAAPSKTVKAPVKPAQLVKPKVVVAPKVTEIPKPAPKKHEPLKDIKVPKTSVKTSVPYQPDYKPLEQRQKSVKGNEPLVRYSDSDLAEFREIINKKLEAAKKELAYLQGLITRKDEMGGDEAESRYMTMEDGSMSMEREQLSQMASRQITYIDHLEKAIIRIENKTYGICRVTGRLIDKARLRAVPHATLSLEAKLGIVKPVEQ